MFDEFFWDDRTMEYGYTDHPCYGCRDFIDDECISNGACIGDIKKQEEE